MRILVGGVRKRHTRARWHALRVALSAPFFLVLLTAFVAPYDFQPFSSAFAAGKAKGKAKDHGKSGDAGGGAGTEASTGGGPGQGKGNANGNGANNGNGNGVDNGITDGNGLDIELGDGVSLGMGIGNDGMIGAGLGIRIGDQRSDKSLHSLDKSPEPRRLSRPGGGGQDGWGKGFDKGDRGRADDLDLGKHFDSSSINKALDDVEQLGRLLNSDEPAADASASGTEFGADKDDTGKSAAGHDHATGKPDQVGGKGNGRALGKDKVKEHGKGKALAKGKNKNKDQEDAEEAAASAAAAGRNAGSGSGSSAVVSGSYIDREVLGLGLSPAGMTKVRQLGFSVSETGLEQDQGALVTLYTPTGLDALRSLALLRRELPRESFHLNRIYRPYHTANKDNSGNGADGDSNGAGVSGPCVGDKCYARSVIGWKDKFADCARGIKVGVIDTDADLRHPTFAGQKISTKAFLAEGKQSSPEGHGTGVLALLAGRPDSDTPGLIPEAQFFLANIFFTDGNGETITDTVSLLKSLDWMSASEARVINMSFSGPEDELVQVRLKTMRRRGFVFAAAAGNEGPASAPVYPAAYPEVVAVTAVAKDRRIYPSANRGSYIDVAAPGVRIWTAMPEAREGYRTGTSFAAPFVTAVLALQRPDVMAAPKDELLDHMNVVKLGSQERGPVYGRGLLQAPAECFQAHSPVSAAAPAIGSIQR